MRYYNTTVVNHGRIRNPTDKDLSAPTQLPPEARQLWETTYRNAERYYKDAWDLAKMTAWRGVKMNYKPTGALGLGGWVKRNPGEGPASMELPDPGPMIILGRTIEYVAIEEPPGLDVYRFPNDDDTPELLWSPEQQMLLVLPKTEITDERNPDMAGLGSSSKEFRMWAQKDPRGHARVKVPRVKLNPLGMADTIVYRSSKWKPEQHGDPRGSQEYIHQFGDDVVVYTSPTRGNQRPAVVAFKGGKMDVEAAGIVN